MRCLDDKYEVVTVDTGYKVYMKLHIKNIVSDDIAEYRFVIHCGWTFPFINPNFRCVAKNSLGNSDGSISLYGRWRGEGSFRINKIIQR